jgi:RimJ/RimL family protein N-acetyltransferase
MVMGLLILFFTCNTIYSITIINFDDMSNPQKTNGFRTEMNLIIVDAISSYLQSNSDIFLLLNEVEIAEKGVFNFDQAFYLTGQAIEKLKIANGKILEAIQYNRIDPVSDETIEKMKIFDYKTFARQQGLNTEIMKAIEKYLKNGDFSGIFEKMVSNIDQLITLLENIKRLIYINQKPDITKFWKLLQIYSETNLFGNYATLVFFNI